MPGKQEGSKTEKVGWDRYPLTVTRDRYTGVYSGGEWLAFRLDPTEVPLEPWEDDVTAASYWGLAEGSPSSRRRLIPAEGDCRHPRFVGRGNTPDRAVEDMERRARKPAAPRRLGELRRFPR